jgi:hypothetical protein
MWHSGVVPAASHKAYYREYGGGILSSPGRGVSSESEVARGLSQHQKDTEWVLINLCWFVMQIRVN